MGLFDKVEKKSIGKKEKGREKRIISKSKKYSKTKQMAEKKGAFLQAKPKFLRNGKKQRHGAEYLDLGTGRLHVQRGDNLYSKKVMEKIERKLERREDVEKEPIIALVEKIGEEKGIDVSAIKTAIKKKLMAAKEDELKAAIKEKALSFEQLKQEMEHNLKKPSDIHKILKGHNNAFTIQRVSSGIPGLDGVMEGGFIRNSVNLIGGSAGCGKSIFCMQYLVEGITRYNENGVYLSFEESQEKIFKDFERFGWNLPRLVKEKKLVILYYTPEQVAKVLEAGGGTVREVIDNIGAKRLAVDSLTAFTLLHENELAKRKSLLSLFENLRKWGVTALLVSEQEPDAVKHIGTPMEFEVDGVILLYNIRKGDIRERSLEVFKMRGTKHSPKIYSMKIDDNGIVIFPEKAAF